jgi:hypothetical protein
MLSFRCATLLALEYGRLFWKKSFLIIPYNITRVQIRSGNPNTRQICDPESNSASLGSLPEEIFLLILDKLGDDDLNTLMSTNHDFMRAVGPIRLSKQRISDISQHWSTHITTQLFSQEHFAVIFYILRYEYEHILTEEIVSKILLEAITCGRISIIDHLLKLGGDFSLVAKCGIPLLLEAVRSMNSTLDTLLYLAAQPGVEINAQDGWGQNALIGAVSERWILAVEWLLLEGSEMAEPKYWHMRRPWWRMSHMPIFHNNCQSQHKDFERAMSEEYDLRQLWKAVLRIRCLWLVGEIFDPLTIFAEEYYFPYLPDEWRSRYPKGVDLIPAPNATGLRERKSKFRSPSRLGTKRGGRLRYARFYHMRRGGEGMGFPKVA